MYNVQAGRLKAGFTPAKKMGKREHDVESMENAGSNMKVQVKDLAGLVGQVKEAAM